MRLPTDPQLLRDHAHAEAKRAGHATVEPVHLAAALARKDPEGFANAFGPGAMDAVLRALRQLPRAGQGGGESGALTNLLAEWRTASDPAEVLRRVVVEAQASGASSSAVVPDSEFTPPASGPAHAESQAAGAGRSDGGIPEHLRNFVEAVVPDAGTIGRDTVVDSLVQYLAQQGPDVPALVGEPGSGRTAVLSALATRLSIADAAGSLGGRPLLRVIASRVIGDQRSATLRRIVRETDPNAILALDDTDLLTALGGSFSDPDSIGVVTALVTDPERLAIVVLTPGALRKLQVVDPSLAARLQPVVLPDLDPQILLAIARDRAPALASFHQVTFSDEVLAAAAEPPWHGDSLAHPGLLLDRLDLGATRAAQHVDRQVAPADLRRGRGPAAVPPFDQEVVRRKLADAIVGQDHAIANVVTRLAVTRRGLDLKPARPDGVFLFVGPTGVGKTALAQALGHSVFGDPDACIRLDMSEYAHDWALSRLIGPQPGYVGYTEPEGWLTTRVRECPHCVILLDEIEKAHPTVWNAFLQVFDAGRLTDARGNVAVFSDTIVIMTSNLGSESFRKKPVGFMEGDRATTIAGQAVEAVKGAMAPELVNRLDEIVVFQPLSAEAILSIATREIERVVARLETAGYQLSVPAAVVGFVGRNGYDPAYGARHLARSIEKLLLEPLIARPTGSWRVVLRGDELAWEPVGTG